MSAFLSKWRTNNIHCYPLIHHTKHLIIKDYHVGQVMIPPSGAMLIDSAMEKWNSTQWLQPSAKAKVCNEFSPGIKRVPLTETDSTGQKAYFSSGGLCSVASSISSGGLICLICSSFFSDYIFFLARQCLFRVGSFQTQGNTDLQSWGKKLKGVVITNTRHLLGCQFIPT